VEKMNEREDDTDQLIDEEDQLDHEEEEHDEEDQPVHQSPASNEAPGLCTHSVLDDQ
jgi:hypothetical protein